MRISRKHAFGLIAAAGTVIVIAATGTQAVANGPTKADRPGDTPSKAISATVPGEKAAKMTVSPAGKAAETKVNKLIRTYVAKHKNSAYTFGSWVDARTGEVVIRTDASTTVVDQVLGTAAKRSAGKLKMNGGAAHGVGVKVAKSNGITDDWHRRDDSPDPHWGGAGIASGGGICSAGYTVKNASGYRYMVTAGHCWADGSHVTTESGTFTSFGWVTGRALASLGGGPRDMELIYGRGYTNRIYTGGITSTSSTPVVAAGTAYAGYTNYCHSGRTTGENCGHTAQSISGQVCTQSGCKSPVIVFTGGTLSQPGDSGSPFYAKGSDGAAWIRGHVIAGDSSTAYAETYDKVAARYGVSIYNGS